MRRPVKGNLRGGSGVVCGGTLNLSTTFIYQSWGEGNIYSKSKGLHGPEGKGCWLSVAQLANSLEAGV